MKIQKIFIVNEDGYLLKSTGFFSSPELRARKLFWSSVSVCPSVCKLFIFFIFFSRTNRSKSTKLGTSILGWWGFKFVQMKGHALFQGEMANFNQTWHKASLGEGNSNLFQFPMKGHALYQGEINTKWWKYIDKI